MVTIKATKYLFSLYGAIYDLAHQPLANVRLQVYSLAQEQRTVLFEVQSDQKGKYRV